MVRKLIKYFFGLPGYETPGSIDKRMGPNMCFTHYESKDIFLFIIIEFKLYRDTAELGEGKGLKAVCGFNK